MFGILPNQNLRPLRFSLAKIILRGMFAWYAGYNSCLSFLMLCVPCLPPYFYPWFPGIEAIPLEL